MSGLSLDMISLVYFKSCQEDPGIHWIETRAEARAGVPAASGPCVASACLLRKPLSRLGAWLASEPHNGLLPVKNPVPWRGLSPAQLARPVPGSHGWVRTHKYVEAVLNSVSKSCPENTGPCFEEGPAICDPWCRWAGGRGGGDRQAAQPPRVRRGRVSLVLTALGLVWALRQPWVGTWEWPQLLPRYRCSRFARLGPDLQRLRPGQCGPPAAPSAVCSDWVAGLAAGCTPGPPGSQGQS